MFLPLDLKLRLFYSLIKCQKGDFWLINCSRIFGLTGDKNFVQPSANITIS